MPNLALIKAPQSWAFVFVAVAVLAYRRFWRRGSNTRLPTPLIPTKKPQPEHPEDAYYDIESLSDLDIYNEGPVKIRPYKSKYHLTMAIENIAMSDLVAMDKTYPERISLRKDLIRDSREDVLAHNSVVAPAVLEFYSWLTATYLPRRFPTVFTARTTGLFNHITSRTMPLHASSTGEALQLMGENIDDDFLFLLPIPEAGQDQGKYRLEGFITCFPSGFNTRAKLGLTLADIHGPVPHYKERLEKSMDRFFASLPIGKIVRRHNWSITTNEDLFALSGTHFSEEEMEARRGSKEEYIDFDRTVLRCERQTLHRLPETKALVFAFKTYQYPIKELRDEGSGEALARAIDGLGEGNAPGMTSYKRQIVWGERVKAFLKGEDCVDG